MECLTIFFSLLSMIRAHDIMGEKEIKYEAGFSVL
jgi:hypothetical protein